MSVEDLLALWRQYKVWAGYPNSQISFEAFMMWLENEYWLKKPVERNSN